YRTLLLLLYGTGMRIGEALHLTLQDVDLAERVITVRCTKFFKTRLVPIGPKLANELAAHLERRGLLPMPLGEAAPLFASSGFRVPGHSRMGLSAGYRDVPARATIRRHQLSSRRTTPPALS